MSREWTESAPRQASRSAEPTDKPELKRDQPLPSEGLFVGVGRPGKRLCGLCGLGLMHGPKKP